MALAVEMEEGKPWREREMGAMTWLILKLTSQESKP